MEKLLLALLILFVFLFGVALTFMHFYWRVANRMQVHIKYLEATLIELSVFKDDNPEEGGEE